MGIVEKFIKEGQLTKEEYPELLHLYQDCLLYTSDAADE